MQTETGRLDDAALAAALQERDKPKKPRTPRVKKPKTKAIAVTTHNGKSSEIAVPVEEPKAKAATPPKWYKKEYVIREGDEEKGVPPLKVEKQFGPFYMNREQRRDFARSMVREAARRDRRKKKAA